MSWGTPTSRGSGTDTTGTATNLVISSITVAQNSLILVTGCLREDTPQTITVTDSASNTYAVFQATRVGAGDDVTAFVGYAAAATALSGGTVTVTYGETI